VRSARRSFARFLSSFRSTGRSFGSVECFQLGVPAFTAVDATPAPGIGKTVAHARS
jgi:hypothetical protein